MKYTVRTIDNKFIKMKEDNTYEISETEYTLFDTADDAKQFIYTHKDELKMYLPCVVYNKKNSIKLVKKNKKKTIQLEDGTVVEKSEHISFNKTTRKQVYRKSEGHCMLCGKFVDYEDFTVDHIVPLAKGGTNDISNLQCTCKRCNTIKQDIMPDELVEVLTEMIEYDIKKNKHSVSKRLFKVLLKEKFSFRK